METEEWVNGEGVDGRQGKERGGEKRGETVIGG